jgi:curved DNA-binding protein
MAVKFRDYYEVLGVARTAKPDAIKRAYRKLARQHHPDLQPQEQRAAAAERFKEINEAYEVLSDADKRKRYDALGEHWKNGMDFEPPPGAGARGARPGGGATFEWGNAGEAGDFSDFFASLFGEQFGHGARRGRRAGGARMAFAGGDIEAELPITIEEALHGGKRAITLGSGRSLQVTIPAGSRDGTALRLAGQGEPGVNGGAPGDLFLHLRLAPHARWRVAGDDLEADLVLWPWQAALGASVRFETPDGPVALKVPAGTPNGRRLRLRERGLTKEAGGRGDLHAVVRVTVPAQPNAAEREAYEALQRASAAPPDRPAET